MVRRLVRTGIRCAAVAAATVLPVIALAGPAGASSGDWGFFGTNSKPPGNQNNNGATLVCMGASCGWDPTLTFTATASNGVTFLNVGSTNPFYINVGGSSTGTQAGTCTVDTATQVTCNPSGTGTLSHQQGLGITTLQFNIPANTGNGSVALTYTWSDSAGTTNNDTTNDTFLTTVAIPGGPLATPVGFAAAGVSLLAIGGVIVVRRRRRQVRAS